MTKEKESEWVELRQEYLPTMQLHNKEGDGGRYLVGVFQGTKEIEYKDGETLKKNRLHTFELEETSQPLTKDLDGHQINVEFEKGIRAQVWGFGQMDYQLSQIPVGTRIKILYEGKKKIEGFQGPIHQSKIYKSKK